MSVLVCGSVAFDNIMVFEDRFRNHILPDRLHILNISFLVPKMRQQFGGCAGNIAYSLSLLGCDAHPMATVGRDFGEYAAWMDEHGVSRRHLLAVEEEFTARAFIITDLDDNQITAFHPGAMNECHRNRVPAGDGIRLGLISPEGRDGMIQHARQFSDAGIPFLFDPGQGTAMFTADELNDFIERADYLACNDYEARIITERTGWTTAQLASRVRALVVTRGGDGSSIHAGGKVHEIPVARPEAVKDPTGCGDAYRAGLIHGLVNDMDWETTGRVASLMGAVKVECSGGQGHRFSKDELETRFQENFNYRTGL
ncbi:MAG: carbohydrate kinase family protein [Gammaproteobacteria bacterium]|nr:carbohydrate kinase family protein [Gammaproteobacteria bacterium]